MSVLNLLGKMDPRTGKTPTAAKISYSGMRRTVSSCEMMATSMTMNVTRTDMSSATMALTKLLSL